MTEFSFSLNEFVKQWRSYQETERYPKMIHENIDADEIDLCDDFMDDFNDAVDENNIPHNLSEKEFMMYFVGCDAAIYKRLDVFFNGHKPSDLIHILGANINLDLDIRFDFDESGYPKMFATNYDMGVDFNAERLFDPFKETVHHDVMHVLVGYECPMGSGIGKQFLSNSIAFYDAIGYKKIIIPDPQQNGVIAWLKAGFRVPNKVWDLSIKDKVIATLNDFQENGVISSKFAKKALSYADKRTVLNWAARIDRGVRDEMGEEYPFNELFFSRLTNNASFRAAFDCGYHADLTKPMQRQTFDKYFQAAGVRSPKMKCMQRIAQAQENKKLRAA